MASSEFVTFGAQHLVAAAIVLGGATGLVVAVRASGSARLDRVMRWVLAAGCLAYESYEILWPPLAGLAPWQECLPLHLCDLSLLLAPVVLLRGDRRCFELFYFWGIGGALQSIATPTLFYGFPARHCVTFFLSHWLIITSALYATVMMRLRPTPWSIPRVWLITLVYGLFMLPVNYTLGTNFLYVTHKPLTISLLDCLGPWPWYLLTLQPVIGVVIFLCYLPFFVHDRRSRKGLRC